MEKQELELRLQKAIEKEKQNEEKYDQTLREDWQKHEESVDQIFKKLSFLKRVEGIIKVEIQNGTYNRKKAAKDEFPCVLIEGDRFTIMVGKKYKSQQLEVHSVYENEIFSMEIQKTTYEDLIDNIAKLLI